MQSHFWVAALRLHAHTCHTCATNMYMLTHMHLFMRSRIFRIFVCTTVSDDKKIYHNLSTHLKHLSQSYQHMMFIIKKPGLADPSLPRLIIFNVLGLHIVKRLTTYTFMSCLALPCTFPAQDQGMQECVTSSLTPTDSNIIHGTMLKDEKRALNQKEMHNRIF